MHLFKTRVVPLAIVVSALLGAPAQADPVVPGFTVSTYAWVDDPMRLTFAPDGVLYVGRDNVGSGGSGLDPVRIHRIGIGGAPIVEYGDSPLSDPDAVAYDANGAVSGVAGSVLVGGQNAPGDVRGYIAAIHPDQTVSQVIPPSSLFENPRQLALDQLGRLLLTDPNRNQVVVYDGAVASVLFTADHAMNGIAIDAGNRIFTKGAGVISIHASDGSLVDGAFATGLTGYGSLLEFGSGDAWGDDLYTIDGVTGNLLRFALDGTPTVVGSGFTGNLTDFEFGPDGALYVSMFSEDRIIRIIPEPAMLPLLVLGALAAMRRRPRRWVAPRSKPPRRKVTGRCQ